MKGYPVILNNLIIRTFRLKCKDERRRRNNRLGEGMHSALTGKTCRAFSKKKVVFSKKDLDVFQKNPQGHFCNIQCKLPICKNVYVRIGLHIRWHKPTRIYVSSYTYVRMNLHIYMYHQGKLYITSIKFNEKNREVNRIRCRRYSLPD